MALLEIKDLGIAWRVTVGDFNVEIEDQNLLSY